VRPLPFCVGASLTNSLSSSDQTTQPAPPPALPVAPLTGAALLSSQLSSLPVAASVRLARVASPLSDGQTDYSAAILAAITQTSALFHGQTMINPSNQSLLSAVMNVAFLLYLDHPQ
jgi:hypothetical protein